MYQAGCAGDLKGGALGDLPRALEIEDTGIVLGWLGIALATVAVASGSGLVLQQRIAGAVAALFLGFVGFTILGIQFEVWGVQHCFSTK